MKNLVLVLGLATFGLFSLAGIAIIFAYQQHKENEKLKSGDFDWSGV